MARLPDLEAWAIFAAVAEHRSFVGAATTLGLSKATVSKAIARLEASNGAALFHRTSRRLSLTDSGAVLAERAARLLEDGQALDDCAREATAVASGLVRLAAPMSFGLSHVAPLVAQFLADYPEIEIDLSLNDAKVDLVGGGFDAALRIAALTDSSLLARRLRDVAVHIVAAPAYLDRRGAPRHPSELASHELFTYAYFATPEAWQLTHRTSGETVTVKPRGRLRCNNADAVLPSVVAGHGIAIMPDFVSGAALADGRVVTVLDAWTPPPVALHLVTPPGRLRPRRVNALLDFLTERLSAPSTSRPRNAA